ncbi:MAG: hypothetical protein HXS52_05885 [Theionarchaea archaeon]|nr:hypothetical protein [Theionarchaea archaeon]
MSTLKYMAGILDSTCHEHQSAFPRIDRWHKTVLTHFVNSQSRRLGTVAQEPRNKRDVKQQQSCGIVQEENS